MAEGRDIRELIRKLDRIDANLSKLIKISETLNSNLVTLAKMQTDSVSSEAPREGNLSETPPSGWDD